MTSVVLFWWVVPTSREQYTKGGSRRPREQKTKAYCFSHSWRRKIRDDFRFVWLDNHPRKYLNSNSGFRLFLFFFCLCLGWTAAQHSLTASQGTILREERGSLSKLVESLPVRHGFPPAVAQPRCVAAWRHYVVIGMHLPVLVIYDSRIGKIEKVSLEVTARFPSFVVVPPFVVGFICDRKLASHEACWLCFTLAVTAASVHEMRIVVVKLWSIGQIQYFWKIRSNLHVQQKNREAMNCRDKAYCASQYNGASC